MKTTNKVVQVPLKNLVIDRTQNVREDEAYKVDALKTDIAFRGQQDAITVEKIGNQYFPIKGFLRSTALLELAAANIGRGAITDEHGQLVPGTGEPFEFVNAFVYEGLSDRERMELLLDHGQRRGLNKVELQNAFERAFSAGYVEKDVVTILQGLLAELYPPNKTIENTAEARLAYYRGVVQTAKHIWRSPTVLHDACVAKLKGLQSWPTNTEMREMSMVHQTEVDTNIEYNKQNPGPKFRERWAAYLKKQADAAASGERRAKSDSMMNRSQVEDCTKSCDSIIVKSIFHVVLRRIAQDKLPVLDKLLVEQIEKNLPEDIRQQILALSVSEATASDATTDAK